MKNTQRRNLRAVLRSFTPDQRHQKAVAAARRVLKTETWARANVLFVYLSAEHEIDTTPLVEAAWREGKRVLAPRVDRDAGSLTAVEIRNWGDCLPGFRGLIEPIDGDPFPLGQIDLAIVPGLAFDHRGYRLGRAGGYFARWLADPSLRARRCGFAFEEQVVPRLSTEPLDEPVHLLATDAEVREFDPPPVA